MKLTGIDVVTQVDRLKAFRGGLLEPTVVETEKVVKRERDKKGARDRRDEGRSSKHFSLQPEHLSRGCYNPRRVSTASFGMRA
jgi:hypothetical protein